MPRTYIHLNSDEFCTCNRCGGFSDEIYAIIEEQKIICPECFSSMRDCIELNEAVIIKKETFEQMVHEMREEYRHSAWALYSSGSSKKLLCDAKISFEHDNLGRPTFAPKRHLIDMHRMMHAKKKWMVTAISAPNIDRLTDSSLKNYANMAADANLMFIFDCTNRTNYRCYRKSDLSQIAAVVL